MLHVADVSVLFGGVLALDDVELAVDAGQVTGLIGPNGAGKTTLFNVVCGLQPPTRGQVALDGDDITALRPFDRARRGVGRTFQRLEIFGSMTAYENVRLGAEIRQQWDRSWPDPDEKAAEVMARVGLWHVADERADALPTGHARLVELGRALAAGPRVLLLDEPSSGLSEDESDQLGLLLRDLAGDGLAILLVEHDVDLVMGVCDRIHVLDFGHILAVGTPGEVRRSEAVQQASLGTTAAV
ncbi:MAG: ABC-type branched-chain amino acid transport system, ATPase component [Acidimicrobiales bacterium]|nr:ABC-type branched-chain amino acid transport system, ATPase component [Acidimicrobiales bacterium]